MSAEAASSKKARRVKAPATLRRTLVTPEGVDLGVELAPLSVRLGAFVIDAMILVLIIVLLFFAIAAAFVGAGLKTPPYVAVIVWSLCFFFLRNGWFAGWEMSQAAATPGKRLMKIRVAMRHGGRLTADAVFARNVTREMELFLPLSALLSGRALVANSAIGGFIYLAMLGWTLIFLLIPLFNRDKLRAGDLLGGTWVVMAPREVLRSDLARDAAEQADQFAFTREQIDAYGVMELQVLENVLRRMDPRIVRDVARRIRNKIGWVEGPGESDVTFLKAYYAALRGRLERQLLFGRRRKDKHDTP